MGCTNCGCVLIAVERLALAVQQVSEVADEHDTGIAIYSYK